MFIAGLLVFSAASLAGGLAHDPVLLVAARVVQGAGAALVAPAALSLITTGLRRGPQRNRALGMYGATASVGFVAGQVLGGVLVQFTSWRAVFLVNVPVGLVAVALAPWLLGESRQRRPGTRLDGAGALLIAVAVAAAVFAVSQADVLGLDLAGPARRAGRWRSWPPQGSSSSSGTTPIRWSAPTCSGCPGCARPAR